MLFTPKGYKAMTDIVQRLLTENTMYGYYDSPAIQSEAAKEITRLREALSWYANENNYKTTSVHMCGHSTGQSVLLDKGNRARNALEVNP
jgi:hypothetical protein